MMVIHGRKPSRQHPDSRDPAGLAKGKVIYVTE